MDRRTRRRLALALAELLNDALRSQGRTRRSQGGLPDRKEGHARTTPPYERRENELAPCSPPSVRASARTSARAALSPVPDARNSDGPPRHRPPRRNGRG